MTTTKKPEQIVLRNVRVRYARLIRPGQAFDESQPDLWSANMYCTTEDRDKLKARGCTPKVDRDGAEFFVAKRNARNKKGDEVPPPSLVDGAKQPFTSELGNGSVCNIAVTPFEWTKAGRSGVILYLNAVQVLNHVPVSNGIDAFDVVDMPDGGGSDVEDDDPF